MGTEGGNDRGQSRLYARLVDVDPDFVRLIPEEEREQAQSVKLPAIDLPQGEFDPVDVIAGAGGWYGVLMEGMLNRSVRIGDHLSLRLFGPSAVIPALQGAFPAFFASSRWSMASDGRIAVLGEDFLRAARRWPPLYLGLLSRTQEQTDQLVTQLTLCQLPRVEDRLLAMFWLLSESWGKVTSAGTILPLHFTHEALGAMVGARRSTVTLALGKLTDRGAVVERDGGWLLLELPPEGGEELSPLEPSRLIELGPTAWSANEDRALEQQRDERRALFDLVGQLRAEHLRSIDELRERINQARAIRDRTLEIRRRLAQDREALGHSDRAMISHGETAPPHR